MTIQYMDSDTLRATFCSSLSRMYVEEVPLYGDLVELVDEINEKVGCSQQALWGSSERIKSERHGAIRLGKPGELALIARLFKQMGMHPVGYYDLSSVGLPVHATAFRPISAPALSKNPFRVFTSLLRPELIEDPDVRTEAMTIIEKRNIFPDGLEKLIDKAEAQGGLSVEDAEMIVKLSLEIFKWHDTAIVTRTMYERMKRSHPLLADIAGFQGPHINHLTPRVLDIDEAQSEMAKRGITPKQIIEGPPKRKCAILLRQTSFQALTEPIRFIGSPLHSSVEGSHRARFGEIELRGCALTPEGHELYLKIMDECKALPNESNDEHQKRMSIAFSAFPDDWETLRRKKLAYFRYMRAGPEKSDDLEELIESGSVKYLPIEYEDFLPASAAGIFQSNLGDQPGISRGGHGQKEVFEKYLGQKVHDYFGLYEKIEQDSLRQISIN